MWKAMSWKKCVNSLCSVLEFFPIPNDQSLFSYIFKIKIFLWYNYWLRIWEANMQSLYLKSILYLRCSLLPIPWTKFTLVFFVENSTCLKCFDIIVLYRYIFRLYLETCKVKHITITKRKLHCNTLITEVEVKQGAAKRRAPRRDLWWGPGLGVSRKY